MTKAKTLSLFALAARIPDEAAAVAFFENLRWPDGQPECPHCRGRRTSPRPQRRGHRCNTCRQDFSVRTDTVLAHSHLPLRKWVFAMYLMQTARKGISALQLSKELACTYRAAWFLAHRLRAACEVFGPLLDGVVEADETFIGGRETNRHARHKRGGRGAQGKAPVLGLRERASGRVVAVALPHVGASALAPALRAHVSPGATLVTDEWAGYRRVGADYFLRHRAVNHSAKQFVDGMAHTNGIESVWAVLKRGFYGTFHQWSVKHLRRYIAEFSFRLSAGSCRVDTTERLRALGANMLTTGWLSYRALVA